MKGLTCETPPSTPPSLLLLPVVEHSQLRQAAELGEKYEDFRVLVQLCERTGNREQLREYMARFSAQVPSMVTILGASFPGTTSGEWPSWERGYHSWCFSLSINPNTHCFINAVFVLPSIVFT